MPSKFLHAETSAVIFFLSLSKAPSHVIHFLTHSSLCGRVCTVTDFRYCAAAAAALALLSALWG